MRCSKPGSCMCPSYLMKEMGNPGQLVEGVGEHLRILLVCQRVDALERVAVTTTCTPLKTVVFMSTGNP